MPIAVTDMGSAWQLLAFPSISQVSPPFYPANARLTAMLVIHYGFGKNIWDIYPQHNITKAYKVGALTSDFLTSTHSFAAFLRFCSRIQSINIPRQDLRLPLSSTDLPVHCLPLHRIHYNWNQFCDCHQLDAGR